MAGNGGDYILDDTPTIWDEPKKRRNKKRNTFQFDEPNGGNSLYTGLDEETPPPNQGSGRVSLSENKIYGFAGILLVVGVIAVASLVLVIHDEYRIGIMADAMGNGHGGKGGNNQHNGHANGTPFHLAAIEDAIGAFGAHMANVTCDGQVHPLIINPESLGVIGNCGNGNAHSNGEPGGGGNDNDDHHTGNQCHNGHSNGVPHHLAAIEDNLILGFVAFFEHFTCGGSNGTVGVGSPGPPGPPGPQGVQGIKGDKGDMGDMGDIDDMDFSDNDFNDSDLE